MSTEHRPETAADVLRAGVGVTDITPPVPYRLCGRFSERLSTGVKDPLLAKAVVFAQGDTQAALVFVDICLLDHTTATAVRSDVEAQTGIPATHIAVCATHSHTGPLYFSAVHRHFHEQTIKEHGRDIYETIDYPQQLTDKIVEAITLAAGAMQPVHLEAGTACEERLSFNRRFHMRSGPVRCNPGKLNADIIRAAGPIDPQVGLVSIKAVSGDPLALIISYALHLDTHGGTEYSADYPGVVQDCLRNLHGNDFVSLFGLGTCGDINHHDVTTLEGRSTQQFGQMLAQTVANQMADLPAITPSLAVCRQVVELPVQSCNAAQIAAARQTMEHIGTDRRLALDLVKACKIMALHYLGTATIQLEVQVFRISDDLAIVTLPGEIFVELGLAIRAASPFATTLVIELANAAPDYIPTRKAFDEGSYETVNSIIAPGGGEQLVDTAVRLLHELA